MGREFLPLGNPFICSYHQNDKLMFCVSQHLTSSRSELFKNVGLRFGNVPQLGVLYKPKYVAFLAIFQV